MLSPFLELQLKMSGMFLRHSWQLRGDWRRDLHGTSISPVITCRTGVGARCVRSPASGPGTAWRGRRRPRSLYAELPSKNESTARPQSAPSDGRYYSV